jgi:hypothetical protein
MDVPTPIANGWETFVNHVGQFTYAVPANWHAESCEDSDGGYLVAPYTQPICGRGEYYDAFLSVGSRIGDQRTDFLPPPGANGTKLTSSTEVSVSGLAGTRFVDVQTAQAISPAGTVRVLYLFFNGTRTYFASYTRDPGSVDRTADFDRSVRAFLTFSG